MNPEGGGNGQHSVFFRRHFGVFQRRSPRGYRGFYSIFRPRFRGESLNAHGFIKVSVW
jgi:hypothetical protein